MDSADSDVYVPVLSNRWCQSTFFWFESKTLISPSVSSALPTVSRRKYTFIHRKRRTTVHNIRSSIQLQSRGIHKALHVRCCAEDHLSQVSVTTLRQCRQFFWSSMNQSQRKHWVSTVLSGLSAEGVSTIFICDLSVVSDSNAASGPAGYISRTRNRCSGVSQRLDDFIWIVWKDIPKVSKQFHQFCVCCQRAENLSAIPECLELDAALCGDDRWTSSSCESSLSSELVDQDWSLSHVRQWLQEWRPRRSCTGEISLNS